MGGETKQFFYTRKTQFNKVVRKSGETKRKFLTTLYFLVYYKHSKCKYIFSILISKIVTENEALNPIKFKTPRAILTHLTIRNCILIGKTVKNVQIEPQTTEI